MNNMNTAKTAPILLRTLLLFVCAAVVLTASFFPTTHTPRAHALAVTVVGGPGTSPERAIARSNAKIQNLLEQFLKKELQEDPKATAAAQEALKEQTEAVIEWAGNGFIDKDGNTSPLFITNIEMYRLSISNEVANDIIFEEIEQSGICEAFKDEVMIALTNEYQHETQKGIQEQVTCPLDATTEDTEAFLEGDFEKGGWSAWFEMVGNPENTPLGSRFANSQRLQEQIAEAQEIAKTQADRGNGFRDKIVCFEEDASVSGSEKQEADGSVSGTDKEEASASAADDSKKSTTPSSVRNNCVIATPAIIIQEAIAHQMGMAAESANNLRERGEVVPFKLMEITEKALVGIAVPPGITPPSTDFEGNDDSDNSDDSETGSSDDDRASEEGPATDDSITSDTAETILEELFNIDPSFDFDFTLSLFLELSPTNSTGAIDIGKALLEAQKRIQALLAFQLEITTQIDTVEEDFNDSKSVVINESCWELEFSEELLEARADMLEEIPKTIVFTLALEVLIEEFADAASVALQMSILEDFVALLATGFPASEDALDEIEIYLTDEIEPAVVDMTDLITDEIVACS